MRVYLPLLLFFALSTSLTLSAQVKENPPLQGKAPELEDPLYTRSQGQWVELSLRDIRQLISPQIVTSRFPNLSPLLDHPKWLLKIISTEQDELYFIDAFGNTVLLEKDFGKDIEALQSEIESLKLRLNDPAKSDQSGLQITAIRNDTVFFSNGAHLVLPTPEAAQWVQELRIDGLSLSINEGNSINLAEVLALDCCSDNQTLELSGSMLSIFGGNTVDLSQLDADSNPKNELQELSLVGNKLTISQGNSVLLPFGDALSGTNAGNTKSGLEGGGQLALIPDYATLRSQPPQEESLVFIYGEGIRGFFWRVDEAHPDGGTVIESPQNGSNIFWQRVRPPGFYKLDWWTIGDPMPSGQSGDTIRSAADVINIILEVSQGGAIIDVSGDDSPRTILLDKSVLLYGDVVITGAGDTFKRKDAVWTTLSASVGANAQSLPVASSEGFYKGQSILVVNGNGFQQNNGKTKTIKNTDEGSLQIQGTLGTAMSAGDTVSTVFTMFKANGAAPVPLRRLIFNNVNFDGNWPGNTCTHDWRFNNTINISSNVGTRVVIENAYFRRTPSENIITGNLTLRDSEADSLAGSLVHISTSLDTTIGVLVENVRAKDVNLMTHELMGHSEGFIVSSASPQYIKLHKILAINGREAFVGDLGSSTDYWEIQDCRVQNFKHITVGRLSANFKKISGLRILNNQFINCNQLGIANGSLLSSRYTDRPRIENNLFVNTGIHLEGSIGAQVTGNQFIYDAAAGGYAASIDQEEFKLPMGALVYFSDFQDLNFSDNLLIGSLEPNDTVQTAVLFDNTATTDNNVSKFYYLGYGLRCHNNQIHHFQRGIAYEPIAENPIQIDVPKKRAYHDFNITNNSIWLNQSNGDLPSWGIVAGPGVHVLNNRIYAGGEPSDHCYPLYLYGVSLSARDKLLGPIVQYNQIYGKMPPADGQYAVYLGALYEGDPDAYSNAVIRENLLFAPIKTPTVDQGLLIMSENTILSQELQELDNFQLPPMVRFGEF